MNWSELNWVINAAVVTLLGVAIRAYFANRKEEARAAMELMLWRNGVDSKIISIKKLLDPITICEIYTTKKH